MVKRAEENKISKGITTIANIHTKLLRGPVNIPVRAIPTSKKELTVVNIKSDPDQGALKNSFTNYFSYPKFGEYGNCLKGQKLP